jgi:hypothetical protein
MRLVVVSVLKIETETVDERLIVLFCSQSAECVWWVSSYLSYE